MMRLHRWIIALFPREFRQRYADDMRDVLSDQLRAAREHRGIFRMYWTSFAIAFGLLRAVIAEHRSQMTPETTRRPRLFENTKNDLRFAARMLRKSPIFTVVAVSAIALGAGAVATIFSAMNAMVLRPLAGTTNARSLVGLQLSRRDGRMEISATLPAYQALRDANHSLTGLAAWGRATFSISSTRDHDGGAVVAGAYASGNYFSVLGVRPTLGRFFLPEEDRTLNTHPVVVVSHAFWSVHLGADSGAIGETVSINGHPYTVIGVAPDGFRGVIPLIPVEAWVPVAMRSQIQPDRDLATVSWLRMFGRLRTDVTHAAAQAELSAIMRAIAGQSLAPVNAPRFDGIGVSTLRAVPEDARRPFLAFMTVLLIAAGFVLFIASVNVAAMLSARAIARRREMAVRSALGASRARLVTQMLTEILLLFSIGAAGAIGFAFLATHLATHATLPTDVVVPPDMSPDLRVMTFALLVSLLTGLVFGLVPAMHAARSDVALQLRDGAAGAGTRRSRVGNALIVGQLALSLILLIAAGLFFRAVDISSRVDVGFDREDLSIASFDTHVWGLDDTRGREFYRELHQRIISAPGVIAATYASYAPLTTRSMNDEVTLASGKRVLTWLDNVGDEYFDAMRMPLLAGRGFLPSDDERAPRVVVINEELARQIAPGGDAIGRTVMKGKGTATVVGIVRNAKYATFDESTPSMLFSPIRQAWQSNQTLLIRSALDAGRLSRLVRDAMQAVDPTLPVSSVMSLEQASGIVVLPQRIAVIVTGVLGAVGLLLAAVGLYGVITYSVYRRSREMGIRLALGGRPADVLGLVMRDGARLAAGGVVVGIVLAAGAARVVAGFLLDVHPLDLVTYGSMSALLVAIALVATYLPARRAAAADPMAALRAE